jgi:hypothetical protein
MSITPLHARLNNLLELGEINNDEYEIANEQALQDSREGSQHVKFDIDQLWHLIALRKRLADNSLSQNEYDKVVAHIEREAMKNQESQSTFTVFTTTHQEELLMPDISRTPFPLSLPDSVSPVSSPQKQNWSIDKLASLLEKGLISQEEFEEKKKRLFSNLEFTQEQLDRLNTLHDGQ